MSLPISAAPVRDAAAGRMDAMYRYQRHIYDLSRKFYLFGRDRLLRSLPVAAGDNVLEIGCGTGRNLIVLKRLRSHANIFGVDVSAEMLETAAASMRRAGFAEAIPLAQAGAADFDPRTSFGVAGFDVVYFSYVLSMIPDWQPVVEHALDLVRPGGVLAVVDFADQATSGWWRRTILLNWLRLFHVHPRAEIEQGLRDTAARHGSLMIDENVLSRYAYLLIIKKRV